MNQRPKKNLAESILARAELYRRGMLFDGMPSLTPDLEMPAPPMDPAAAVAQPPAPGAEQTEGAAPANPGLANQLVAGAVSGQTPLQSIVAPK